MYEHIEKVFDEAGGNFIPESEHELELDYDTGVEPGDSAGTVQERQIDILE